MSWTQDLLDGLHDADHHDAGDAQHHALPPVDDADFHLDRAAHPNVGHVEGLVLAPGGGALDHHLACPDPLTHLGDFGFPCYTHRHDGGALVDLDGDGVMDATAWGTPVIRVEDYVRGDGTVVHGHYRSVANGTGLDNLRR